jgi:hypothetical protein
MDRLCCKSLSIFSVFLALIFSFAFTSIDGNAVNNDEIKIYEEHNGWAINASQVDPHVQPTMDVVIKGKSVGKMAFIKIFHKSDNYDGAPEVAILYASGYIRLKQNADPKLTIPFGGSFVLGPAYNGSNSTYKDYKYNNSPQLDRLEIDTSQLPKLPLKMKALGSNRDFNVTYDIMMPMPTDQLTRLHVNQTYIANDNITINKTAKQKHEGFKLVQFSSMFINENATCDLGKKDCHDTNAARYMGSKLVETAFKDLTLPSFIFDNPQNLSQPWLDLLHLDNDSWHYNGVNISGNTPNLRIILDEINEGLIPQGWIRDTTNPNDDNVGLWIHDDGNASTSWKKGQEGLIGYWLLAQDNSPEIGVVST